MAGTVSTTATGMQAAAKQFDETLTNMNSRLQALHGQLDAVVWTADSRNKFDESILAWEGKFKGLYQHLTTMAQIMGANANDYQHRELDAAAASKFFK
jgi:WXG100 family type VII secretion target